MEQMGSIHLLLLPVFSMLYNFADIKKIFNVVQLYPKYSMQYLTLHTHTYAIIT